LLSFSSTVIHYPSSYIFSYSYYSCSSASAPPSAPAPAPAPAPDSGITLNDIRKAVSLKVNDHREAIKAKLLEIGAASVTKIDPSKYQEMINFLNSL
ncbi:MAG: hypothetical protein K2G70_05850, partial [Turicibacter sp.]|nr:hypothetical protein [Turicibacter sp.]